MGMLGLAVESSWRARDPEHQRLCRQINRFRYRRLTFEISRLEHMDLEEVVERIEAEEYCSGRFSLELV